MTDTTIRHQPSPGDWYVMQFNGDRQAFYVVTVTPEIIGLSKPSWLSDELRWLKRDEFYIERGAVYIGKGRRSLLSFLPFIGNCFPKYTRP